MKLKQFNCEMLSLFIEIYFNYVIKYFYILQNYNIFLFNAQILFSFKIKNNFAKIAIFLHTRRI